MRASPLFALSLSLSVLALTAGCGGCGGGPPAPTIASITVSPASATIAVGETQQFRAVALDAAGKAIENVTFLWSSNNGGAVPVGNTGIARGLEAATVNVTAAVGNVAGSASLTVVVPKKYRLTVKVNGPGTGEVYSSPDGISCTPAGGTCTFDFLAGTEISLTARPQSNNAFSGWSGDCAGSATNCPVTMNADRSVTAGFATSGTLTVALQGTGTGTVSSAPSGINCSPLSGLCSATYAPGTSVTLTATALAGGAFVGWGGDCTGAANTCTVVLSASRTVTASFAKAPTLTVIKAGGGTGTITSTPAGISCATGTCTKLFNYGASVTLDASVSPGNTFAGWSGGCTGAGPCELVLTGDTTVTGTILPSYKLTVTPGTGGAVASSPGGISCPGTCSANYNAGTNVDLTPSVTTPGYRFSSWTGGCTGSAVPCVVQMNSNLSVSANFEGPFDFTLANDITPAVLSLVSGESRTVSIDLAVSRGSGLPVTLTSTAPPAGVTFAFSASPVTPTGSSTLTITANAAATLGTTTVTVTGTSGTVVHTTVFQLQVRSAVAITNAVDIAIEPGNATAIVSEADRLTRIQLSDMKVVKTLAGDLGTPQGVDLEPSGNTALTASGTRLYRVNLTSGGSTLLTNALFSAKGVIAEANGSSALVTDCGLINNCTTAGRLVRVELATGTVTAITPAGVGINDPRGIVLAPGGGAVLVAEHGTGKLLRVDLGTGGVTAIASQFYSGLGSTVEGVKVEAGNATALVTSNTELVRVDLASGRSTRVMSFPAGWAPLRGLDLLPDGEALVVDNTRGQPVKVNVEFPLKAVAPSAESIHALFAPYGIAVEAGDATALVTDCFQGICVPNGPGTGGRLMRVNLNSGLITQLLIGINNPRGVVILPGGTQALVVLQGTREVIRVTLADGTVAGHVPPVATPPEGISLRTGAGEIIYTAGSTLLKAPIAGGASSVVSTITGATLGGVVVNAPGTFAFVLNRTAGSLLKVDLANANVTTVATGLQSPVDVALDDTLGLRVRVTDGGPAPRLLLVDTTDNAVTVLAGGISNPKGLGVRSTGESVLVDGTTVGARVALLPTPSWLLTPRSIDKVGGAPNPAGFQLESGELTALMVTDCGWGNATCVPKGSVVRVTLQNGTQDVRATGLASPKSLAIEAGGLTALVSDCGPANACTTAGRVARVKLSDGTITPLATNLDTPDGITIEAGGATALVTDKNGGGRLLRMNTTTGAYAILASGLANPRQSYVEGGGATALVAVDNALIRVVLSTGATSTVAKTNVGRFAVEPEGATALVVSAGTGGPTASISRVNLATGAVRVAAPQVPAAPGAFVLNNSGLQMFWTETRSTSGMIFKLDTSTTL